MTKLGRLWRALFPPPCEHPPDGQTCPDSHRGGVMYKHYPPGEWRKSTPPPVPPRSIDPGLRNPIEGRRL